MAKVPGMVGSFLKTTKPDDEALRIVGAMPAFLNPRYPDDWADLIIRLGAALDLPT